MENYRVIFRVIGYLLAALAIGMLFPSALDGFGQSPDWLGFFVSAVITGFIAVGLILTSQGKLQPLSARQAFILTSWSWIALAAFAAIPFMLTGDEHSYTDAFFESMSGLTTTGATIMTELDTTARGILLWRALLQWFGGIGIIVMAISILPMLNVGGMQLFRLESSDTSEKIFPRTAQIALSILQLYLYITIGCATAYFWAGMGVFDALIHAMTTISTGGFSTHDASLGYFDNPLIEWVGCIFMLIASLPFVAYLRSLRGKPFALWGDRQIRGFVGIAASAIILLYLYQLAVIPATSSADDSIGLTKIAFNTMSILTGTGYTTANYSHWGTFAFVGFFILAFIGGCAGSTSCGLKIFRLQVALKTGWRYAHQLITPHGIFPLRYNNRILDDDIVNSVMVFVFLFFLSFFVLALILSLLGLDVVTAFSAAASSIANVGPGLGAIVGPSGNYAGLPDAAKWVLSLGMLLGRLEFLTILAILTPRFWSRSFRR